MSSYQLSSIAEQDLEGILEYTFLTWGEQQFERYQKLLIDAFAKLAENPAPVGSKSRKDLRLGCRTYRVGHHYIVYQIGTNNRIEIGRILHENMDFTQHSKGAIFD